MPRHQKFQTDDPLPGFQRSSDHVADRRAQAGQPTRYSAGLLGITTSGMGGRCFLNHLNFHRRVEEE
jgi:hypothetical protein